MDFLAVAINQDIIDQLGIEALRKLVRNQMKQVLQLKQLIQQTDEPSQNEQDESVDGSHPRLMSGWMMKWGHKRKTWLKRFFVLLHTHLVYYNEPGGSIQGAYNLNDIHLSITTHAGLEAIHIAGALKATFLRAPPPDGNQKWVNQIEIQTRCLEFCQQMKRNNTFPDPRVLSYFRNPHSGSLNLDHRIFHPETAKFLSNPFKTTCFLQKLSLVDAGIGPKNIHQLCDAIRFNESLIFVILDQNQIDDACAALLSETIRFKDTVAHVSLRNNLIGDDGFSSFLLKSLSNKSILEVCFSMNRITSAGFKKIYERIRHGHCKQSSYGSLSRIDLERNLLDYQAIVWLQRLYHDVGFAVHDVILSGNNLGDDVVEPIIALFERGRCNMRVLDLSFNGVCADGMKRVVRSFLLSPLNEIHLGGNDISIEDIAAFASPDALNKGSSEIHSGGILRQFSLKKIAGHMSLNC
eukprot:TRINITY_DN3725_c0_g1_i1.p1 TRINITY_DN3725_c0_g1~~TRINITY_DN3725_c0_g1_i1.p1  ORF type:complete len:465 (-),score=77.47 TRINITY_DN3725_c0_g1_i1:246-1640(-)